MGLVRRRKRVGKHYLYEIEYSQFGLGRVDAEHKVECRIVAVDEFVVGAAD